jgi:hypothetical protein
MVDIGDDIGSYGARRLPLGTIVVCTVKTAESHESISLILPVPSCTELESKGERTGRVGL